LRLNVLAHPLGTQDIQVVDLPDDLEVSIATARFRKSLRKVEANRHESPGETLREHADDVQDLIGAEVMVNAATRKERRGRGH
jgi:hypothetical protein